MIVTFAVIGIMFSTLDILVRPVSSRRIQSKPKHFIQLFHSHNGCFIYFTLGSSFRRSKTAAELGLCELFYGLLCFLLNDTGVSCYSVFIQSMCGCKERRMKLLVINSDNCRPEWAKHFDGWKYALWLLYTLVSGILWALASNLDRPDEVTLNYMRSEVLQNYGVEIRNVPHFAVLAYVISSHSVSSFLKIIFQDGEGDTKTIRWNSVECIGTVSILMGIQYSIMMISGLIMYRRTQGKLPSTCSQQEKMQKQFFVALIYQVAAPTLFFQLPGFVILIFPFFDFKISFHSGVVIYGFSAYPLVDTLIVFKVITEYKIAYKRFVNSFAKDCIEMLGGDSPRNPPPSYTRTMAYAS
ncbi:hypothetical protein CAEBREN_29357 [Caenorhabditis brenneri]|uniref:Seven TM Receptor n=1 Tax=Caenorhabditis brenneri TaxID=135651 RepID=G0NYZ6_CAEBE|nr:hypothetical protein CAEBREN_29357 [Caenorhabditis brenneri]